MGFLLLYVMSKLISLGLCYHNMCVVETVCTNTCLYYTYTMYNTYLLHGAESFLSS